MGECPFGLNATGTTNSGPNRLSWTPSTSIDVVEYAVYAAPAGNSAQFLARIDAGLLEPVDIVTDPEAFITDFGLIPILTNSVGVGLPDGNWQFVVCTIDTSGNYSDPYQSLAWVNAIMKFTPPAPPVNGGVD